MLRRAYERSIDVDERARCLFDIQATIRYAQQGLDYARIQENIREYEEGLALGNEQPALLQATEIQIRNSDPLIQKLLSFKKITRPRKVRPGESAHPRTYATPRLWRQEGSASPTGDGGRASRAS